MHKNEDAGHEPRRERVASVAGPTDPRPESSTPTHDAAHEHASHATRPPETASPPETPAAELESPATTPTGHKPAKHGGANRSGDEKRVKNRVREIRLERMMSKAELARRAAVSTLTIDRIERGLPCRMDTKRKILEALGLKPSDRLMVFGPDDRDD